MSSPPSPSSSPSDSEYESADEVAVREYLAPERAEPSQLPSGPFEPLHDRSLVGSILQRARDVSSWFRRQYTSTEQKRKPLGDVFNDGIGAGGIDIEDVLNLRERTYNYWNPVSFIDSGTFGSIFEVKVGWNNLGLEVGSTKVVKILKMLDENEDEGDNDEESQNINRELKERAFHLVVNKELLINMQLMKNPHPNLLVCHAVFKVTRESERGYLIMDLSDLGTIGDLMNWAAPHGFSEHETRWLIRCLSSAVQHLHRQLSMAHCDIKESNILMFTNPDPNAQNTAGRFIPKLADFNSAEIRSEDDPPDVCQVNGPRCTICFASPESMGGKQVYDGFKLDVYSLACCLYLFRFNVMLFNIRPEFQDNPYAKDNIIYVMQQQREQDVNRTLQEKVSDDRLRDLLLMSLRWNPNNRLSIEQFIQHPWLRR